MLGKTDYIVSAPLIIRIVAVVAFALFIIYATVVSNLLHDIERLRFIWKRGTYLLKSTDAPEKLAAEKEAHELTAAVLKVYLNENRICKWMMNALYYVIVLVVFDLIIGFERISQLVVSWLT